MSLATLSNDCSICLEKIRQDAKFLRCAHTFHRPCIDLWLSRRKSCPLCRSRQGVTDSETAHAVTDTEEEVEEEEEEEHYDDETSSDAETLEVELMSATEEGELEVYDEEDELVAYDDDNEEHVFSDNVEEAQMSESDEENIADDYHDDNFMDEDMHSLDTESVGSDETEDGELDVGFEDGTGGPSISAVMLAACLAMMRYHCNRY